MLLDWRGHKIFIFGWEPDKPENCEECGIRTNELAPYGRNKKFICSGCGNLIPETVQQNIHESMKDSEFCLKFDFGLNSKADVCRIFDEILVIDQKTNKIILPDKFVVS